MAYDSRRGVTVLFGGIYGLENGETWEWNGASWTQRVVSGPSARYYHAMAYDSARGVTVLFGGTAGSRETWEWNGTTWTLRSVSGPSPRYSASLAYDAASGVTVLFGGFDGSAASGETWQWNGTAWHQRSNTGPSPRSLQAMAYDAARGVTVLFGGTTGRDETWELCDMNIVAHPSSQTTCSGGSPSFSVTAAGRGPITYVWRKDGAPIDSSPTANPSAVTAALMLTDVQSADDGIYDCVVTNACGSITSGAATLSVCACLDCPADFNQDGGIDGSDVDAFFNRWEAGSCDADANQDGGIDGADVDTFFAAWEAGGCG
ncbi:MAG: immunoglobulin domain-containing protein [Planctomycetes bacterium]|nr:immunoglobulin domain-containing protein [Planctomycetota bacterium]